MGPEICDNRVDDNNNSLVDCADPQCTTFPGLPRRVVHGRRRLRHHRGPRRARDAHDGHDRRDATASPPARRPAASAASGRFQLDATADVLAGVQAGPGQRARRRPLPRGRQPELRPQPGRVHAGRRRPTRLAVVLGAGARRLLGDRRRRIRACRAPTRSRCRPDRSRRRRSAPTAGTTTERLHRLRRRGLQEPRVVRRQPVQSRTSRSARWWSTAPRRTATRGPPHQASDYPVDLLGRRGRRRHRPSRSRSPRRRGCRSSSARPDASIFALYRMPAPGLACDANQISCAFEDDGRQRGRVRRPVGRDATCSS